jgi:hypothetical protein
MEERGHPSLPLLERQIEGERTKVLAGGDRREVVAAAIA